MSENKRSNPLEGNTLFPGTVPALPALPEQESLTATRIQRPTPPSVRIRRNKPYAERYTKETISVDNRLLPYFYQLLETYPNNTIGVNAMIATACKVSGIAIPEEVEASLHPFKGS